MKLSILFFLAAFHAISCIKQFNIQSQLLPGQRNCTRYNRKTHSNPSKGHTIREFKMLETNQSKYYMLSNNYTHAVHNNNNKNNKII